jgi:hypothetical protein
MRLSHRCLLFSVRAAMFFAPPPAAAFEPELAPRLIVQLPPALHLPIPLVWNKRD